MCSNYEVPEHLEELERLYKIRVENFRPRSKLVFPMGLAPFNIRVNCVCPGTILTRASEEHMARVGMTMEEFIAAEAPKHLLNRVGAPRECAYPILFLACDESSFITGTSLMVDGGYTAQ